MNTRYTYLDEEIQHLDELLNRSRAHQNPLQNFGNLLKEDLKNLEGIHTKEEAELRMKRLTLKQEKFWHYAKIEQEKKLKRYRKTMFWDRFFSFFRELGKMMSGYYLRR